MKMEDLEKAIRTIKIAVSDAEKEKLLVGLNDFLHWLEPVRETDTTGVDPVFFSHGTVNILRDDRPETADTAALRRAAPNFDEGFYRVPPIID
ncbi:MAG TPA: Asp-tRNA(Asn)/Glu-tRNA(Gln) amidotransferase subunit GatC [Firmicutes bacterium]|nr:Asp-tRNA(Asn)/Glu-tRNA(Gln) amidotransferase subunit GatC [Bacillota bacterium]